MVFATLVPQKLSLWDRIFLYARRLVVDSNQTPTHVPLAHSGYATTESVLFGSAGQVSRSSGAMRAGSGRDLLICLLAARGVLPAIVSFARLSLSL